MQAGFLNEDAKEPEAIDDAALERLHASSMRRAAALRRQHDPEEEPFRSRYEERQLLTRLSRQAAANAAAAEGSGSGARARMIRTVAEAMLGFNFMDTEEAGQALPRLEAALPALEAGGDDLRHVETLHRLGVLKANREEHEAALELLDRASAAYDRARSRLADARAPAPSDDEDEPSEAARLEELHTLTCFYLAQAHGNLGHRSESAAYCHTTLQRQLDQRERRVAEGSEFSFDAKDWARNAATLSSYHCGAYPLEHPRTDRSPGLALIPPLRASHHCGAYRAEPPRPSQAQECRPGHRYEHTWHRARGVVLAQARVTSAWRSTAYALLRRC